MKLLRTLQTKIFFGLLTLILMVTAVCTNVSPVRVFADTQTDSSSEQQIKYIDTELVGIAYVQHVEPYPCVYLGFELTESDYDDFGKIEGDLANSPGRDLYANYIMSQLSYWKNFSSMNNEDIIFEQIYAYWNGSSVGSWFANTVAHRTSLAWLREGFTVFVPQGTTFPSLSYVKEDCMGETVVMYRTTTDKAFYYDGTSFVALSYNVAKERINAEQTLLSVDFDLYYEAEQDLVQKLIEQTGANINACFSIYDIQDLLAEFEVALSKIMTIEDYAVLSQRIAEEKQNLAVFFNGLSQDAYTVEAWNKILALQTEGNALLDKMTTLQGVDGVIYGVKSAVEDILTKEEEDAFAAYCEAAMQQVESAFDETLYREAERAQGLALVQEGKQKISSATSHGAVDALEAFYVSSIDALKTNAQWEEEERAQVNDSTDNDSAEVEDIPSKEVVPNATTTKKDDGCGSMIDGMSACIIVGVAAMMMVIKKRKKDGV